MSLELEGEADSGVGVTRVLINKQRRGIDYVAPERAALQHLSRVAVQ